MESVEKEKAALISDIEADARLEAEAIRKEAQDRAAEKREQARRQVESILQEAQKEAQARAEAVLKTQRSAVDLEVRRRAMHARELAMRQIMARVEEKLSALMGDAGYRAVLMNWIVEAAVGLGAKAAHVNASESERGLIDDQMLAEVRQKVRARTGGEMEITLSADHPLPAQGVVLTAADGRTAFNNQVRTRMSRRQQEMRKLIYDVLFADDK
ncbi:MAG: hypothetical protein JW741_22420 [Sedimentisphaerales bacterium]|nr:hypothetical protein [Sedimentisphaerales bacterium]